MDAPAPTSRCQWCSASLLEQRRGTKFCSKRCRQSAFRLRERRDLASATPAGDATRRFAYADPPYLGYCALYDHHHPDGRCWDEPETHRLLVQRLQRDFPDGWALSASGESLATILPMCPAGARVSPWVKPIGVSNATYGPHNAWEAVIRVGGRKRRPGVRDWLRAMPARGGGTLMGRKPIAFAAWLFDLLGMMSGDELADLYPGTGIIGRAWNELSARARVAGPPATEPLGRRVFQPLVDERLEASLLQESDATSPGHPGDVAASLAAVSDESGVVGRSTTRVSRSRSVSDAAGFASRDVVADAAPRRAPMRILISMSYPKLAAFRSPYLGRLFVPTHTGSIERTLASGIACAADNGCFNGLDEPRFLALMEYLRGKRVLFVPAPDVVGDARGTRERWREWAPRLRAFDVPLAYVLQDGEVDELDAVFVGGTTRWKLGGAARRLIAEAKARGKHVHMGRVNTLDRLRYAYRLGCDTVDGTSWARYSDAKLPRALELLARLHAHYAAGGSGTSLADFVDVPLDASRGRQRRGVAQSSATRTVAVPVVEDASRPEGSVAP